MKMTLNSLFEIRLATARLYAYKTTQGVNSKIYNVDRFCGMAKQIINFSLRINGKKY